MITVSKALHQDDGVEFPGRRLHLVLSHEQHGISMHGISQKTLIGVQFVRGLLFHCGELCRHGHEVFAGPFYLGGEA